MCVLHTAIRVACSLLTGPEIQVTLREVHCITVFIRYIDLNKKSYARAHIFGLKLGPSHAIDYYRRPNNSFDRVAQMDQNVVLDAFGTGRLQFLQ